MDEALKRKAYKEYEAAMKNGILTRPDACENCGESGYVYGHHEDYHKPVDIMWLCGSCHRKRHLIKEAGKKELTPINGRQISENDFTVGYILELFTLLLDSLAERNFDD